ncbi:3-oxoadipate enol-lactonase [Rhizobium sp. SL42]|uniref:3-oxoadipate enol-lactonase n=1 Tax=Rhizobium sp. SL42 TaxID=2806346 RepID=UPI001F022FEE|nr:3-oxoadipate enol-lactonase [Rhizobium sp. SL42]UJW77023.1 3-oxoadipate enol-lactonase [Rhizobium sp. SL42]
MPYLDLAGHRLHYRIDGDVAGRPWLLFCNSLGTDLGMWDRQVAALTQTYRVLRYDRRGHGRSSAPPARYALSDLGGDVLALLDALNIDRVHFCGLSIGGLTGQWLAIHAGDRLGKVVLCATAARIGTSDGWEDRMQAVRKSGLGGLVVATSDRWFTPDFTLAEPELVGGILDRFAATSPEGYVGCCSALADADLRGELDRIYHSLLTVSGEDDAVCPPSDLKAIAANVQRGRHVALAGRHIVNIESSAAFNAVLSDFLQNG